MKIKKDNIKINIEKGVGNQLLDEINRAKERIWIISPYISDKYTKYLKQKNEDGLDIKLITTTAKINNKAISELIIEKENNENKNNQNYKDYRLTGFITCIISLFFAAVFGFLEIEFITFISFILFLIGFIVGIYYHNEINKTTIEYTTPFETHILKNIYEDGESPLVHVKLYLIDKKVFLGSVNFTEAGLWHNIESLIEIKDEKISKKFEKEYFTILSIPTVDEKDINEIAKELIE